LTARRIPAIGLGADSLEAPSIAGLDRQREATHRAVRFTRRGNQQHDIRQQCSLDPTAHGRGQLVGQIRRYSAALI
jgi:hypothetical protein